MSGPQHSANRWGLYDYGPLGGPYVFAGIAARLDTLSHLGILKIESGASVEQLRSMFICMAVERLSMIKGGHMETEAIPGSVTVETGVLETIARLAALEVSGVVEIAERDVDRLLGVSGRSVVVQVREGRVTIELHVIAGPGHSLLQLGRTIQHEVTRAIQQMIGMPVEAVNVHIEDVVYPGNKEWPEGESKPVATA